MRIILLELRPIKCESGWKRFPVSNQSIIVKELKYLYSSPKSRQDLRNPPVDVWTLSGKIQSFPVNFENKLRDVTMPLLKELPKPTVLSVSLTPLSDNSDDISSERSITSSRTTRNTENKTVADDLLGGRKRDTPQNTQDVQAYECIIRQKERSVLDN